MWKNSTTKKNQKIVKIQKMKNNCKNTVKKFQIGNPKYYKTKQKKLSKCEKKLSK